MASYFQFSTFQAREANSAQSDARQQERTCARCTPKLCPYCGKVVGSRVHLHQQQRQ